MNYRAGFTYLEILLVICILGIITVISITTLVSFNTNQALDKDTQTVVTVLEEARSKTLASTDASQYGVHIGSNDLTVFKGNTYISTDPNNRVINLNGITTISNITFSDGGSDIVFKRLTGETVQTGTITIATTRDTKTRTVTIYKTGIVQSN
jgi:type II secretory pathway pseudopilin PulG